MKWAADLWREPGESRASHSRLLALAAFIVVSLAILKQVWIRDEFDTELLLGYLGIMVVGQAGTTVSRHRRDVEVQRMRLTDRGVGE